MCSLCMAETLYERQEKSFLDVCVPFLLNDNLQQVTYKQEVKAAIKTTDNVTDDAQLGRFLQPHVCSL